MLCESRHSESKGFYVIIGIGLNVQNEKPFVSLSQIAENAGIDSSYLTREIVLAEFLSKFQNLLSSFSEVCTYICVYFKTHLSLQFIVLCVCPVTDQAGFAPLRESYESMWLHSGQKVQAADSIVADESGQPVTSTLTIQVLVYIFQTQSRFVSYDVTSSNGQLLCRE